jgi:spore maturation protein SpmB|tara:strand:+ start:96 stop:323 length:228 start_codon:yes stop_codon:yes gene_type:complete
MIRAKQEHTGPIVVDLTGPDGNAFALIGLATRLAKQLGIDSHTINVIKTKMMSGDYEHLLKVFDKYFGDFVILER